MELPIHLLNLNSITSGDMAGDITGISINVQQAVRLCVVHTWSNGSTPVGTIKVQGSNDNTNWVTVNSQALSGNSGSLIYNDSSVGYAYVRSVYTRSSGSATLDSSNVNAKRL